jgi:hypothetical protein
MTDDISTIDVATQAQLRQAALPIKDGGLGHTLPSDVVQPAYLGSRLDTAAAIAALLRMRDAVAAMQDCSTILAHHLAANQVPRLLGATGWDVPTLRTLTRRKTQHTLQSHVHECRGRSLWPDRHASIADVSVMDLIDETRRIAITSPGDSAFLDASERYHPMDTGVYTLSIACRLGILCFLRRRYALLITLA